MPSPLEPLALAALHEVAPAEQIGEFVSQTEADGVLELRFASLVPGHRDWFWRAWFNTEGEPTVLEVDLLPGEDALLAPEWVPWAQRLAEFRATHDRHGNLLETQPEDGEPREGTGHDAAPRERPTAQPTVRRTRRRRRTEGATA